MTIAAVVTAAVLLLAGVACRRFVRVVRALLIPASVVGGLIGLLLIQILTRLEIDGIAIEATVTAAMLRGWPGPLIAVVFAGLLLQHPARSAARSARSAASAGVYAWLVIVGQIVLGIAAVGGLRGAGLAIPASFGHLIEAGFAGGHGTAAAIGGVYESLHASTDGRDLALFMATIGLMFSVLGGLVLVNIAGRRGWTRAERLTLAADTGGLRRTLADVARPAGLARLLFAATLLAAAILVGYGLQQGFVRLVGRFPDGAASLERVPLFLFTLIAGWIVRRLLTFVGLGRLIDGRSVVLLVGLAMELLIVAAVASLRIETILGYPELVIVLLIVGCAWTVLCLLLLAPRLLPRSYWFELGVINFGMSTGTTAQGMMLLRIVDPELSTPAAEDYALAAPMSAPFIGGGLVTLSLPVLLEQVSMWPIVVGLVVGWLALFGGGMALQTANGRGRGREQEQERG